MLCGCSRDRLCDQCVEDSFAQLRGVAACRGEVWAQRVATQCNRSRAGHPLAERRRPWPATERAAAIARRKVGDLTSDARLGERLATELAHWAARRWGDH